MAIARKHIENQVSDKSEQIIFHLIKILKWKDDLNYNKHCDDLNTWFWYCQKKKINSKRIKIKQYQLWIFDEYLTSSSDIDNIIKRDLNSYSKNLISIRTNQEVFNIIQDIKIPISKDLSLDRFEDIRNYIY
jgi:hypothetical protein